ncbi:uncharacterized protein LOC115442659 isoform X2 [Manduca sexta]|uniref:uncharacterized protein LOC115442659 isoform X2 n=1 Tax=Manduca sexta TaxID=7130 RepID=UPI00188FBC0C|nr:uncharacterized protein LOC115442659 isoform X2 [Manduca sexta]
MMSKTVKSTNNADLTKLCKSSFTLTFAVEVVGLDVWHDCNEGWLDLGPCTQGIKIQYQLYPGLAFDVDILIWPHAAKIWSGAQYGWVRTWQFLERRWLTFTIRHLLPVRVADLRFHIVTVVPTAGMGSLGANAKNDRNVEVYLPPLKFGERRYFGSVMDSEEAMLDFIQGLIWSAVVDFIPLSYSDGTFDVPQPVTDIRHQDAILYHVRETILSRNVSEDIEETFEPEEKSKDTSQKSKERKKPVEIPKVKYEIKLSGNAILAGAGRVIPFEVVGDKPPEVGETIVLISTNNLPAQDDQPIVFVNIEKLCDAPVRELRKLGITQLYTRWRLGDEVHDCLPQTIKSRNVYFNDHHVLPLANDNASAICASFLDTPYEIELRGIRVLPSAGSKPKFFGYEKKDRDFGMTMPPKLNVNTDIDMLIAVVKIDSKILAKGTNGFISGEYPIFPPRTGVVPLSREGVCTNDINYIRAPVRPQLVVPPSVILEAQMTLEVSIGLVGCKPPRLTPCFSRLYSLISVSNAIIAVLKQIAEINEHILLDGKREDLLTGFALDSGDVVVLFLEGPKDGKILQVWDMMADFYPKVKPIFSSSARYPTRIYPAALLACPPVYARPALPLPTRSAVLKVGRLITNKLNTAPTREELPTAAELKSFRLELCVAPRPTPVTITDNPTTKIEQQWTSLQSATRINWDK